MGLSIAIGLIVTVAALNIVASLILLVMEKSRDIAILKTMGLSSERVMKIFMLQGLIIGLVGTALGGVGRRALVAGARQVPADSHRRWTCIRSRTSRSSSGRSIWPSMLVSAIVVCFLATIYPSRQASKLDPVQALRFE